MPYEIIEDAEGCNGFAVVKRGEKTPVQGGCHQLKTDALAQVVALNIATEDENYMGDDERNTETVTEFRDINLVPPAYMRASARRGIALHEEGLSGDGIMPATVADARKMASGEALSQAKWRKISPWIARHISDLDAVSGDKVTPGLVAMLLWGGGASKSSARRAQSYADELVERINAEDEERAVPKKEQIFGSKKNPEGSAKDKTGSIDLGATTTSALETKMKEHNAAMTERNRPNWTRVRMGALKAVWRRGAGAFSSSHRPGQSRQSWAMARVNAFLFLARTGAPNKKAYVQDNDLLHRDHPKFSEGERNDTEIVYDEDTYE